MDLLTQLRDQLSARIEEARVMLDRWRAESREPSAEETKTYDTLLDGADDLKTQIKREERQRGFDAVASQLREPPAKEPLPGQDARAAVGDLGLSGREIQRYSLFRAIQAQYAKDWRHAGYERECHLEIEKRTGREAQGFFVPWDLFAAPGGLGPFVNHSKLAKRLGIPSAELRALEFGGTASGAALVAEELQAQAFIDILRNRSTVAASGATMLPGLVGDQEIPKKTETTDIQWIAEQVDLSDDDSVYAQVTLSPKQGGTKTEISRRMLKQGTPSAEALVRQDIADSIAVGIDDAAINGTGTTQPLGLLLQSGVNAITIGASTNFDYAKVLEFESAVSILNALVGSPAWIVNAQTRLHMKQEAKAANTAEFVWERAGEGSVPGDGIVIGYPARVTQALPAAGGVGMDESTLIFGNFADLLIGLWGVLDLFVDPYTAGDRGALIVRGFQDVDVAVRRGESFAAATDAILP